MSFPVEARDLVKLAERSMRRTCTMSIDTYGEPDAVGKAIGYAKFYSRSHDTVIRVYDDAGNMMETHKHAGEFKEPYRVKQKAATR